MKPEIIKENYINDLVAKLAKEIISIINGTQKEFVNMALSGGSTPKFLYEYIVAEHISSVDWNKVRFWWGDERCVPPGNDESNYKMAKESMLDKLKVLDNNIQRIKGEANPKIEAENYNKKIKNKLPFKNALPVFDILLLGLGDDGHTVSIFPDQLSLFNSEKYAENVVHPGSGQNRITITGTVINNAENVLFLVTGKSKAKTVSEIINKTGNYQLYPASYVVPIEANFKWYIDSKAAEKL